MLPVKQIEFSSDTAHRKQWFRGLSFSHPAKMHLSLQFYLIEHYTKPGDTILDCMSGSGTLLVGCALGRNVICVELEKKFVDMQKANWQKIKALGPILGYKMGEAAILQGDARNLEGLLADSCIFSPPFAGSRIESDADNKADRYGHYEHGGLRCDIPETKGQIANLPYGEISAVISSPPYEESMGKKHHSPRADKLAKEKSNPTTYTDVICTSPPYEDSVKTGEGPGAKIWDNEKGHWTQHPDFLTKYSDDSQNIGNLKSENYLQAMRQVYQQCHRVLWDGGLMILVVKNFIRNKKIIRLDTDTVRLCESAGFVLKERLKRKLTQQSFWRTIYQKKYPDAPKIEFEDVLIFRK